MSYYKLIESILFYLFVLNLKKINFLSIQLIKLKYLLFNNLK